MPKFFVENENIKSNKIYITEDYNHIKNVLRKNVGDELEVCNKNNGDNFLCSILNILSEEIECEIIKSVKSEAESKLKVTIFQGLPKQEKMELVIQKCIELGAYEFVPLKMKNCVVKLKEKDKYQVFFGGNYGVVSIENNEANNDKNLLIIKDSYANSFTPFLLKDYKTITIVDYRYFSGNLQSIVQSNNITDVLVLYEMSNFMKDKNLPKNQ